MSRAAKFSQRRLQTASTEGNPGANSNDKHSNFSHIVPDTVDLHAPKITKASNKNRCFPQALKINFY